MAGKCGCPLCGAMNSTVLETRKSNGGIKRRRHCSFCDSRFSTVEIRIPETAHRHGRGYQDFFNHIKNVLDAYDENEKEERSKEERSKEERSKEERSKEERGKIRISGRCCAAE